MPNREGAEMRSLGVALILAALVGGAVVGLMQVGTPYSYRLPASDSVVESTADCGTALTPTRFEEEHPQWLAAKAACEHPIRNRQLLAAGVGVVGIILGIGFVIGGPCFL